MPAPIEPSTRRRAGAALVGTVAGLLVVVRVALAGDPIRGIWAEDGAVFLQDALREPASSLTSSYAGYGHLLNRVLAELGHVVGAERWPTLVLVSSAVVVGATSAVVYSSARSLGLGTLACVAGALTPVLLPGMGLEVLGNWANLQVVLAYGLAWVLLVPPADSGRWVPATFGLLALGSGVACLFVCPLVFLHGRQWLRHPAIPGLAVGAIYQVVVALSPRVSFAVNRRSALTWRTLRDLFRAPGRALVDSGGGLFTSRAWTVAGALMLVAIVVVVARSPGRRLGLALVASAVASLAVYSVVNGSAASRYACLSASLITAALVIGIGWPSANPRLLPTAVVVLGVLGVLALPVSPYRIDVPRWGAAVDRARAECQRQGATDSTVVHLPVGPIVRGQPWRTANLPCSTFE